MNITRRAALRGIASIPVISAPGIALAAPAEETLLDRMERLAEEMGSALDEWIDHLAAPGYPRPHWDAVITPPSAGGYYHLLHRRRETAADKVARLQRDLIDATKAQHPDITDWRVIRPDDFDDNSKLVGMFMVVGHPSKAVQS